MERLTNWTETVKGLYRYVVASNVCYEIIILENFDYKNVLTAKANLYIAGSWIFDENKGGFTRELLCENETVANCLVHAKKDYEENMR